MVGGEEAAGGGVDLARYVRAQFSVIIREEVSSVATGVSSTLSTKSTASSACAPAPNDLIGSGGGGGILADC